jgi:hypothetical protein
MISYISTRCQPVCHPQSLLAEMFSKCHIADFSALTKYLNLPATREKLGVPKGREYVPSLSCSASLHVPLELILSGFSARSSQHRNSSACSSQHRKQDSFAGCHCRWQECNMEINQAFLGALVN